MHRETRYGLVLALFCVAYIAEAWNEPILTGISATIYVGMMVILILDPKVPNLLRRIGLSLGAVAVVVGLVSLLAETPLATGLFNLTMAALLALAAITTLVSLGQRAFVSITTVLGAVLIYVLVALAFADLFKAVEALSGEPFFAQGYVELSEFAYFSLITITTVGFGDLYPGTALGARLSAVEALIGQVVLVVLVASLVGHIGRPLRRHGRRSTTGSPPEARTAEDPTHESPSGGASSIEDHATD